MSYKTTATKAITKTCRHCGRTIWLAEADSWNIWVAGPLWNNALGCLPGKKHQPEGITW